MAIRRDFDVVGIAILAVITALGGGILRDLVLGDTPPPAFTQWEYLVVPLAAAAVTFVAHPELERLTRTLLVFDAAGLGLFCVAGTVKALEYGLAPVAAAALGVTTAVGGGVLRDVIARETPAPRPPRLRALRGARRRGRCHRRRSRGSSTPTGRSSGPSLRAAVFGIRRPRPPPALARAARLDAQWSASLAAAIDCVRSRDVRMVGTAGETSGLLAEDRHGVI